VNWVAVGSSESGGSSRNQQRRGEKGARFCVKQKCLFHVKGGGFVTWVSRYELERDRKARSHEGEKEGAMEGGEERRSLES